MPTVSNELASFEVAGIAVFRLRAGKGERKR